MSSYSNAFAARWQVNAHNLLMRCSGGDRHGHIPRGKQDGALPETARQKESILPLPLL